jgi:hypothetical protein
MATQSASNAIDLQKLMAGAAELELKALMAGVEAMQVWISQAAKLSAIAGETLQAIQDDKASLPEVARRLTDFGRQNTEVYAELSTKMSRRYFDELNRLAKAVVPETKDRGSNTVTPAKPAAPARPVARRAPARKRA